MVGLKAKKNIASKNNDTTLGKKPEITVERGNIKKISRQSKTIETKQNIPKQRKKISQLVEGDGPKTYQQPDDK